MMFCFLGSKFCRDVLSPLFNLEKKMNCPIREKTADGRVVGRCWFHLPDERTCPRHGDVSVAVEKYKKDKSLTNEDAIVYRDPLG